jgi:hypothetical protein
MKPVLFAVLSLGIACSAKSLDPPPGSTAVPGGGQPGPAGVVDDVQPPVTSGLVVHEWGTFTSVNGSDGKLLEGLHHEEEALPAFVHSRAAASLGSVTNVPMNKGLEGMPSGVTQKLETPVIYFYGDAPQAHVRVDFPRGVVSEWFPEASAFGPAISRAATSIAPLPLAGFMEWQVELVPGMAASGFPGVPPENIWAPSRRVASVPVRVAPTREAEQFIFYRGLGAFELPLVIEAGPSDEISVHNRSAEASPAVFLLRVHEGGGAIVELGPLAGGASLMRVPLPQGGKEHDLDVYVQTARARIAQALEASGLYTDEAQAMVDTWSKSYFQSFGVRLLYIVPREWTDGLLPLAVEPAPAALVRTLVGRVEVLTPSEERALLARVTDASARGLAQTAVATELGRLAEPKLRRTLALTTDATVRSWIQTAVSAAAIMP